MDKILVIVDGSLAKYFLEKLCLQKALKYFLKVIYYNDESVNLKLSSENIEFLKFDPTSLSKLEYQLGLEKFVQAFVFMQDEFDTRIVYENLRKIDENLELVIMDFWALPFNDQHLELIDGRSTLSNQLISFLPDVALTAQFIGLGSGEIMEVKIPAGSVFAYRHIKTIVQKKWRIALVYRNSKYFFANTDLMLMPGDNILIVGDPSVLQGVYYSIKKESGQFPSPFGSNMLLILDMKNMSQSTLANLYENALYLHSKINSKRLFIKVINPDLSPLYNELKNLSKSNINIDIVYHQNNFAYLEELSETKDIGLLLIDNENFEKRKKELFELKIPVLKLGAKNLSEVKEALILSSDEIELENRANVMIDLSKQLDLEVKLYHYNPNADKRSIEEYFATLSKLYDKKIKLIGEKDKNPLLKFENSDYILQFISFTEDLSTSNFAGSLSMNLNRLYYKMNKNYQLFIPIS